MKSNPHFKKTLLCAMLGALFAPHTTSAAPLSFSTLPPGQVAIPPAPNVVLSVDNSGSMGSSVGGGDPQSKIYRLKEALTNVFNDTALLPDGKIRLAWQAMWNNNGEQNNITVGATNSMKVLNTAHRANFLTFVGKLKANNSTPSHQMMFNAYNYMRSPQSINSPWASVPGTTETPYMSCRRAYHIFMTDGAWNGQSAAVRPGNTDNTNTTLPDGTPYNIASDQTNVYRGALGNLLADWAMRMWAEDLQPSIPNGLTPSTTDGVPAIETHGAVSLQRYWNPKHDPATWQHMVHYTIGYGADAYSWPSAPHWDTVNDDNYGGDYTKLVQGTVAWVPTVFADLNANNPAELWHMAINSRGKFYPTGPGRKYTLQDAFKKIIENINLQNTADATSVAASASTNIRTDLQKFTAGYNPKKWSGYIKADKISTTGTLSPDWMDGGTQRDTGYKLDHRVYSTRVILATNDATNAGVPFEWETGTSKLSAAQKTLLNDGGYGEKRVNYLRGERTYENSSSTPYFRIRDSIQGDIVNSSVWYVDKPVSNYTDSSYKSFAKTHAKRFGMVYVGGNDGMLHGFKAEDGEELIAYVPKAVIPELTKLSDPGYTHQYYVDGSPFTGDVNVGSPDWRTLLVGTLGSGGKGYFILDVTNPGNFTGLPASNFSTGNANSLVVMDRTIHPSTPLTAGSDDEDIGHIFAAPVMDDTNVFKSAQISKMNDGRWAVVLGNGYNSKNERPVLLIQYLDGAKELKKIVATGKQTVTGVPAADVNITGNGLSAPKPVDINGDGKVDVVYAGDLKGNLWKFDLTSDTASDWSVATWNNSTATPCNQVTTVCQPMFTATYINGKRQPISAPPIVKPNDRGAGGMMVAFGTGVNVTDADRTSTDVQSVYSLLDNTRYKQLTTKLIVNTDTSVAENGVVPESISGRTNLVQQTVSTQHSGSGVSAGFNFWEMSQNTVDYTTGKKGWYFDLPVSSERVLRQMSFFDGSNNLVVYSLTPAYGGTGSNEESCEPAGTPEKAYATLLNIMDGKKPGIQVMDQTGDGLYNAADNGVSRMTIPPGAVSSVTGKKTIKLSGKMGGVDKDTDWNRMPEQPLRPSWRQVQ
jgi:type IV pilus assembly protein PilY1